APRTVAEAGCPHGGLGAPHGAASARVVPVSSRLPARGAGTRSLAGIARPRQTGKPHSPPSCRLRIGKNSARKPPPRLLRTPTSSPARPCNQYHATASILDTISPPQNHSSAASRIMQARACYEVCTKIGAYVGGPSYPVWRDGE